MCGCGFSVHGLRAILLPVSGFPVAPEARFMISSRAYAKAPTVALSPEFELPSVSETQPLLMVVRVTHTQRQQVKRSEVHASH